MEALLRLLPDPQPPLTRYIATVLLVLLSYALKLGMQGRTGVYGFIIFVPAIVASSIIFDRGSGYVAVATAVACVAVGLTWTAQTAEPQISALATFVIIGVGLVFVSEGLRRALEQAEKANRERDLLLEEMSHRVTNKFAMIQSIIGLQARGASPEVREHLDAILGRIKVIASEHQYLQLARHNGVVDLAEFLNRLCMSFADATGGLRPIAISVDTDAVSALPKNALPIGLIVNELVTNALKYAFPDDRPGRINVRLKVRGEALELSVSDDGIGCPEEARGGLGTKLINVLAGQLGGTVNRGSGNPGCYVSMAFENSIALRR